MSVMKMITTDDLDNAMKYENMRQDALMDDLGRYDAAFDLQLEEEAQMAEEDYIYVRDETLGAIEVALKDWDAEEDLEHPAHRIVVALKETDVLDEALPERVLCQTLATLLEEFPETPTAEDYNWLFESLHGRGWVHL